LGKKNKAIKKKLKKEKKRLKKERRALLKEMAPAGCKTKCCEKYQKCENKRCSRCPCFDLMKNVA
jgi:hypothetical protein